ncbi:hypothetical protein IC762_21790 [Bradyrhizobium genosp. L]|uniref:hypothetical protein n=1 Tax=Bradyrhizobium genosp. L TaxID=83637 RepID=UPI0018A33488|nr:hypothetical protein [Bradyrhizobium genosp. L]QPF82389.1 hypothetical protein IC762_21790 [Bradyrhizobium genosp. L]
MGRAKFLACLVGVAAFGAVPADAGFRSPESLIRNVYAHYGRGSAEFSNGLPRDEDTARQFFDPTLRDIWTAPHDAPYDFLVQSPTWRLGAISITVLRRQFDRTYMTVTFDNQGRAVTLSFVVMKGPEGWVITDVESAHDSLRMFLVQFRR